MRGRGTGTLLTAYVFTHDRFSATMRVRIPAGVHLHQTHTPLSNIFFFFSFFFLFSPFLFFLGGGSLLPKKTFHEEPKNDCDEHTWPVPANAQCTGAYLIQYYFYSWKLVAYHIKSYRIVLTCATLMTRVTMKVSPSVNLQAPRMKKAASKGAVISAQPVSTSVMYVTSPCEITTLPF